MPVIPALKQTYSLFEDASGETIVEDVPGASHAARKPNKPIKITIFSYQFNPFRYKVSKIRFSQLPLQMQTNPSDLNYIRLR